MKISFKEKGDYKKVISYLNDSLSINKKTMKILERYALAGVDALSRYTPKDTGKTADSWGYEISEKNNGVTITFTNSNIQNGVPIAIILQYGHATGNGGYVTGIDYVNPAIKPIFEKIVESAWKEVTSV